MHDEIGYWSELKLEIIKKYAAAYSKILDSSVKRGEVKKYIYVDAFAGSGKHISKTSGNLVKGSPQIALDVAPPFHEYHFIDLNEDKTASLKDIARDKKNVFIHEGNCNNILMKIYPRAKWNDYHRALVLLDPYGLDLNWEAMYTAGAMKSIEIFLNFPIMDMNRNVLWDNHGSVDTKQISRMNAFWGDDSWREAAYAKQGDMFGGEISVPKQKHGVVDAFKKRLKEVAGFKFVPDPIPMRNSNGAVVYYLFFASPNDKGAKIVREIFDKYRNMGMKYAG